MRFALGVGFLGLQIALVLASQAGDARWFSWAPHTVQVSYALDVVIDGRTLAPAEVARRFGVPAKGWEAHAVQNLKDLLVQHARTYGREDDAVITLTYSINGRPPERWVYPEPAGR